MKSIKCSLIALGLAYSAYSYAEAQVVDARPIDPQEIRNQTPLLSLEQRVARLEQQLDNRQQFDLTGQISSLQQAMQDLRGQVDVLSHQQKQLEQRLNDFYQDLSKRVDETKPRVAVTPVLAKPTVKAKPEVKSRKASSVISPSSESHLMEAADNNAADNFPLAAIDSTALSASDTQGLNQPLVAASNTTTDAVQEQNAYQTAYNALKNRNYAQSIPAMESYLQQYPNGKYAASAHYWLGELYMVQGQPDKAASQFNIIMASYPKDTKVADANLKLGIIYYNKGQFPEAKQTFTQVKAKYSGTAAARLADARLQEMARNGK